LATSIGYAHMAVDVACNMALVQYTRLEGVGGIKLDHA
jgi:hypothetical protein